MQKDFTKFLFEKVQVLLLYSGAVKSFGMRYDNDWRFKFVNTYDVLVKLSDASRAMVLQGHSIKSQLWSTGVWGGEDSLHSVFHKEGGSHNFRWLL